jgi:DNA-binding CsgD family transcriptional regulator
MREAALAHISTEVLSSVIGLIYEAGYDQRQWSPALASIDNLFHASRTCIVARSPDLCVAKGSYDDREFELLNDVVCLEDPLTNAVFNAPIGHAYRRGDIHDEQAFRRRPLWQDWMAPREMDLALLFNLKRSQGMFWSLDISRPTKLDTFDADELHLLETIAPHVRRALEINHALRDSFAVNAVYDNLPFGMLTVDADLQARHWNEIAEELLARADAPLTLRNGRITLPDHADERRFRRLVEDSCSPPLSGRPATGGTALFRRQIDERTEQRFIVSVAPLSTRLFDVDLYRQVAVMIREAGDAPNEGPATATLKTLFDLSSSEAAVTAALAGGKSLKEIAESLGIKFGTARKYLENIFQKTGTHRQGELIALISSLQPMMAATGRSQ